MSKLDKAKERLGVLKFWLAIVVGTFLALGAWMAQNYKTADDFLLFGSSLLVSGLIIALFVLNQKINKKIDEIGEL